MDENKVAVVVSEYGPVTRIEFTPTDDLYNSIGEYAYERYNVLLTEDEKIRLLSLLVRDAMMDLLDEIDTYLWSGPGALMSANCEPVAEHIQEMLDSKF